ncbi:MAG: iron-sulfur cluster assembly scaffold protein [Alphaproteobacteria bacterium]|nr:MAG: iron-sulfur cluster assembly scaffold protein [Alphaproteobacteria bacterium]
MSELRDLYQEIILDHNKRPRNFGKPAHPTHEARGDNPLCGDKVTVYLTVENGLVKEAAFEGRGCAISTASASLMTESVKGKPVAEVQALFHRFHDMMTGNAPDAAGIDELDKLQVLSGVREYPMRVKCATLSWHTLTAALEGGATTVSTEAPGD